MIELQEFSKKIEHRDVQFFSGLGKQFPWVPKGVRESSPKSNYYLISSTWSWGTEAMKMKSCQSHRIQWGLELRSLLSRCTTRGLCSACDQRWFQFSLLTLFQSVFSLQKQFIERVCSTQYKSIPPLGQCLPVHLPAVNQDHHLEPLSEIELTLWGSQLPHMWDLSWSNWFSKPHPGWTVICIPTIAMCSKKNSSYWRNKWAHLE